VIELIHHSTANSYSIWRGWSSVWPTVNVKIKSWNFTTNVFHMVCKIHSQSSHSTLLVTMFNVNG